MMRIPRAGGDAAEEKKRLEEENKIARKMTVQNVLSFFIVCGLIRAAPWVVEQVNGS